LEFLVSRERLRIEDAFDREREAEAENKEWENKLEEVNATSAEQLEARLRQLADQEAELDALARQEAEATVAVKHRMEDEARVLEDQLYFMTSLQSLNEERLDYEIHVLKKHEEEIILVKSEQKRKVIIHQ